MEDVITRGTGSQEFALHDVCCAIGLPDAGYEKRAWERLDSLTKPPRSLGGLEAIAARMAAVQRIDRPTAAPAAITLFAGDHGVVAEGVSAWPSEVTRQMMGNFVAGGAAINQIAGYVGARLVLTDVGVATDTSGLEGVVQAKVRPGTRNMVVEPAMTREEAAAAMLVGVETARRLAREGVKVICTGEMGIGNTTSASALTAAYTGVPVSRVIGPGTGMDDAGLARKAAVVKRAILLHQPGRLDPLGTLAALGGFEIAAMAGVFLGCAAERVCGVVDGFISASAALVAARLCPDSLASLFGSHISEEPGHSVALVPLELDPFLRLRMRLGEGTGAALAIPVMGAACAVLNGMATFDEAGVVARVEDDR
ncbi:MAG: nicotinate-nucleotide--dimethylbenzimidazole phosphoribosyltransferase [Coriobacteriia bacterium]|nr:nicotinate-nucleotide--dimethylbenzimidazole phosphoribosyltransferase [Coriobacteriia bacterium]